MVDVFIKIPLINGSVLDSVINAFTNGYGKLRSLSPKDNFYLYLSYTKGLLNYLFFRKTFTTIGQFLRKDMADENDIKYYVKARSDNLSHVAATAKPWTERLFKPKKGEIVIDAGAYIGKFTLYAAFMGAYVISVEPNPIAYGVLKKNIELNGFANVEALNVGLGDAEGEMKLYVPRGYAGNRQMGD